MWFLEVDYYRGKYLTFIIASEGTTYKESAGVEYDVDGFKCDFDVDEGMSDVEATRLKNPVEAINGAFSFLLDAIKYNQFKLVEKKKYSWSPDKVDYVLEHYAGGFNAALAEVEVSTDTLFFTLSKRKDTLGGEIKVSASIELIIREKYGTIVLGVSFEGYDEDIAYEDIDVVGSDELNLEGRELQIAKKIVEKYYNLAKSLDK